MPRVAKDYSKTIIYKIACKDPSITDCYIGCTTNFSKRKSHHKHNCNNNVRKNYIYQFIRANGGWNNWDMVMVEEFNCDNELQASARERHWFDIIKPTLNMQCPNEGTGKLWRDNHPDYMKEYGKEWRDNNPDYFKNYRIKRKENNNYLNEV
jgi:predicted GIY-YIG superfamily endonuclease